MLDFETFRDSLADRYRVDRPLGAGGMATVFLAHDIRHDRPVAIKVLRSDVSEALGRERFLREIRLAARLSHPHILPLFDSGEADGTLFFVMPVMQGQTLRERLAAHATLPVHEALRIAAEVADALDYAHRHDVVHRDIKPENILLHEGHAVVADFGIGKALAAAAGSDHATMTQLGVVVGTPAYLSPEQAAGDVVDGRSDLFALGCVLFEMLTGTVAFTGTSTSAVIARRFVHTPPLVSSLRADVPEAIAALTARLLAREPEGRFATGAEVADAARSQHATPTPGTFAADPAPDRSIAVLPFANLSGDAENDFFSDGLAEELITDLSSVQALRVISRASARQLKGTTKGMREIGRLLGVRYALTGSARKAGNALRVTAQLVDTSTDAQLWAERFSGTLDDVFDVQERMSRAIVAALQVTLSSPEDARLAARPIRDARAYELYLKAQELVRRYGAPVDRVLTLLDHAASIDGESLPIRALRAYVKIMQMRAGMRTDEANLAEAEAEAHAILAEAPESAHGHALLGFLAYERGDLAGAVRGLTAALERDASDADARFFLGIALQAAGQADAAFAVGEQFLALDPLSPMAGVLLGASLWFQGLAEEGLRPLAFAMTVDPDNPILRWTIGYTHVLVGQWEAAREHAEWMHTHVPTMPYTLHLRALVQAHDGDRAAALATVGAVGDMTYDAHLTFHLAEPYALAGDADTALRLLADGVERGFYPAEFMARHCAPLAPLRGTPGFEAVVARAAERVACVFA